MKLDKATTLEAIAQFLQCKMIGNAQHSITGINEIHKVEFGDIVFVDHPKYYKKALTSAATTILINQEVECPEGKGLLISENPFDDFNKLTRHFRPEKIVTINAQNSSIHPKAIIGHNVTIGEFVVIEEGAIIHPGAYIGNYTTVKKRAIIGPNTVIGHSAFYYKKKVDGFDRMHSCGRTIIEEDAEIGALCTIDRGVSGDTIIGKGTKIDNQVHIGHDTTVGEHCLFAANVGIAGCVTIKNHVTLWGQVGLTSDIVLENNTTVLAQSGVNRDLEEGKTYFGSPAGEARAKFRELAAIKRIPEILENM